MTHTDSKPWYRQFWPWFLIAIPLSSMVMGVIMITLAVNGKDTLVRENWYKDGMAINQRMDKQLKAKELGIKAALTYDKKSGALFVATANVDTQTDTELTLHLIHPTLKDKDRTLQMFLAPNNQFYTKLDGVPQGFYYLLLTTPTEQWEIDSSVNFSNPINKQDLIPNG